MRSGDRTQQLLDVVLLLTEVVRESYEQRCVARRICRPQIVHRLNDSAPHQIGPYSINHHLSEERVLIRSHPRRQGLARIDVGLGRRRGRYACDGKERPRIKHDLGQGMLHASRLRGQDHLFAARDRRRQSRPLMAHASKVGGETKEILLSPLLERMVMALGALQANAEKQLADHGRNLVRLAPIAEHGRRAVPPGAALSRHQLADELIVWLVLAKAVANPMVVIQHRLDADSVRIRTQ